MLKNHPDAQQADNLSAMGKANLLSAKGGFDPKLYGDFEQKAFNDKRYFTYSEGGLKLPTWWGIEGKIAYATSRGNFVNPSDQLPTRGQGIVGISMPLLQGLLIDERRNDLLQARQFVDQMDMERLNNLLDLEFEAASAYWKWALATQQYQVYQRALSVSQARFEAIKTSYELGERMAMDTLEAFIIIQDRINDVFQAAQDQQKAMNELENFLWQDDIPYSGLQNMIPPPFDTSANVTSAIIQTDIISSLNSRHPALRSYDYKLTQLAIDRRWKKEKLKPKLNINYNFLGDGAEFNNLLADNYKWGIQFSTPTLFRKERGDLEINAIKSDNTRLMRDQKWMELRNKLENSFANQAIIADQIRLYNQTLINYERLLALENERFILGESSIFLINNREIKFIEAQLKWLKLRYEYEIQRATIRWASGGDR